MDELTLFIELLKIDDPALRRARLDEVAGNDINLRARIDELLEAHLRASKFMDTSAHLNGLNVTSPAIRDVHREQPGDVIGPYKLLQVIGEGGMGSVFMAEQTKPVQRRVALKIIKAGMDSKSVIARFEAERQALAMMDHPNIAKVLDAGSTGAGHLFFVMELVKGVEITKYCDEKRLKRSRRYATSSLLAEDIGRYLNNEQILACPASLGYRLRKMTWKHRAALATAALVMVGLAVGLGIATWQAIRATNAQNQADIHATEARKSELHALEEQRKARDAAEAERLARDAELVERLKAEKQAELAEDRLYFADMRLNSMDTESANISRLLENLLDHVPVAGEKDRRRWDWYFLLGLCHENQYELMDAVGSIQSVAWSPNGQYLAISSIGGSVVIYETDTWKISKKLNLRVRTRGLSWSPDSRHVCWGTAGVVGHVSKSPSVTSAVTVFNVETEGLFRLYGSEASVFATTWSPDGEQLASAGMDLKIRVWNWKSRECEMEFPVNGNVRNLDWHPNLPRIVASVTAQDIMSNGLDAVIIDINQGPIPEAFGIHDATTCRWNTDGSLLAIGKSNGVCSIYDSKRWTVLREWPAHQGKIISIEWSKDSQQVITGGVDSLIHIWNRETGALSQTLQGSTQIVNSIDLSPDGHQIASGDATAKIWSFQTKPPHRTIGDKQTKITQIDWRKGSRTIDSITENQIIAWDVDTGLQASSTPWKSGQAIGINSRGEQFAVVERGNEHMEVFLHDLRTGARLRSLCEMDGESTKWFYPHCLCFNIDASKIGLGIPLRFKSEKYHAIAVVGQEDTIAHLEPYSKVLGCRGIAFAPNTAQIACIGELPISAVFNSQLFVLDVDSGKITRSIPMSDVQAACLAWSHDGKRIVTGDMNGMACVWDPVNRTKLAATQVHSARVHSVACHPSDSLIVSQGGDRIAIWDSATGEELIWLPCKSDSTGSVKWSPDGKCLAATDAEGRIQVWDASTGFEYANSNEFKNKWVWSQLSKTITSYQLGKKDLAYQMLERAIQSKNTYALSVPNWITDPWIDFVSRAQDRTLNDLTLRCFPDVHGSSERSLRLEMIENAWNCYELNGEIDKAKSMMREGEAVLREVIEQTRHQSESNPVKLAGMLARLGENLLAQEEWSDSETALRECLTIRESTAPDLRTTFSAKLLLGTSLLWQEKFDEAELLLVAGWEGVIRREQQIQPVQRPVFSRRIKRVAELYRALEKPEAAASWQQKLEEFDGAKP